MARRSNSEWAALIEEQSKSGISATAFCKERNINDKYFSTIKSKISKDNPTLNKNKFHAIAKTTIDQSIYLHHNQIKITIPVAVDPCWLAQFVKGLL